MFSSPGAQRFLGNCLILVFSFCWRSPPLSTTRHQHQCSLYARSVPQRSRTLMLQAVCVSDKQLNWPTFTQKTLEFSTSGSQTWGGPLKTPRTGVPRLKLGLLSESSKVLASARLRALGEMLKLAGPNPLRLHLTNLSEAIWKLFCPC